MTVKVQKWGNSLAIRIPKDLARKADLDEGTSVDLTSEDASLVLRRSVRPREYSLKELMDQVTPDNMHAETEWGQSVGKERFWEGDE